MTADASSAAAAGTALPPRNTAHEPRKAARAARALLLPAAILLITIAVYARTIGFDFVFDDRVVVVENYFVHSWQHVPDYFSEHVFSKVHPTVQRNYYRPVFLLWLLINHTLFGLAPWGWHLTTVIVHGTTTLLVYFLTLRLSNDRATSAIAGLIFGLHPAHIESVAWVAGGAEPLAGLFLISSFLCYLKTRDAEHAFPATRRKWLGASLALGALAMLSKEGAVTLPLLIAGCQWSGESTGAARLGEKSFLRRVRTAAVAALPYLAIVAAYLVARAAALRGLGRWASEIDAATLLLTLPSIVLGYLRILLWPVRLSAFYDVPYVTALSLLHVGLPVVLLASFGLALWWAAKRSAAAANAAAWLILPLLPVLDVRVFPRGEVLHDRYLYLPSVGFVILVALGIRRLEWGRARVLGLPAAQTFTALLLSVTLSLATILQLSPWKSNFQLFLHGHQHAPQNALAASNLATEFFLRGQTEEAIRLHQQVLSQHPDYWLSCYNLGFIYYNMGKLPDAESMLLRATRISPVDSDQFLYLGLAHFRLGRTEQAEAAIRQALGRNPAGRGYHFALGIVLKSKGRLENALAEFLAELKNNPGMPAAQQQVTEIQARLHGAAPSQSPSVLK